MIAPPAAIGIIGAEEAKFTAASEADARRTIRDILTAHQTILRAPPLKGAPAPDRPLTVVSGGCHLGGVDIWAEEEARAARVQTQVFLPKTHSWTYYKARNIQIAEASDIVHVIVVDCLPSDFIGMRHALCYHCQKTDHVKSGACFTARYAQRLGKPAIWHVIRQR